jgi:NAD+ kinase
MTDKFVPKSPVVVSYPKLPEGFEETQQIVKFLRGLGFEAPHGPIDDEALRRRVKAGDFDLLIALGGDGTMLRAGHLCAPCQVPILGVNMGRLGFLIQIDRGEWRAMFERLFQGEGWIEERLMLHAEHVRAGEQQANWQALNEVVVGRGVALRPVRLEATVDGRPLTTFVCDGLIASTPTGSTAYALAAGGPILPPDLRNILLVPIAPHLSVDRAVVLAEGSSVAIGVRSENSVVSVDGQTPIALELGDHVDVRASEHVARFVRFGDPGYFYRNLNAHLNQPHL